MRYGLIDASDLPSGTRWLGPGERQRFERFRFDKPRGDFLLGRWAGKHAIRRTLGLDDAHDTLERIEILAGPDGAPRTTLDGEAAPVSLSLSHSGSRGLCLITADETVVGCDIEFIEARSAGFVEDYFTEPERRLIHAAAGARRTLLPTLLWSAKESALKILHEGLRMDTREVEVRLHEPQPGPWQRMEIEFLAAARVFPGWWREDDGYALTFAADTPADSPMSCPQRFEADSAVAPLPN